MEALISPHDRNLNFSHYNGNPSFSDHHGEPNITDYIHGNHNFNRSDEWKQR